MERIERYSQPLPHTAAKLCRDLSPKEVTMLPIDGRLLNIEQFRAHIVGLDLSRVTHVVIHHTYRPDEDAWRRYGGWVYWRDALRRHYESLGWTRGPHLFVSYEGIGLFYDMTRTGRAVGGGYLEPGTLHIEMVGDFMTRLPAGATLTNSVQAAAAIMVQTGAALTNHNEVVGGWECPGNMLKANWGWFRGLVQESVDAAAYLPHIVEADVWDAPTVLEKTRWWLEEEQRQREAGNSQRAQAIRLSLIGWILERELRLKAGVTATGEGVVITDEEATATDDEAAVTSDEAAAIGDEAAATGEEAAMGEEAAE
jgi:hypothetical protein